MEAVVKHSRGEGNVDLLDMPEPEAIAGHVVIAVEAAGICGTDIHIYHDEYPTDPPVILGHELAGVVAEVGRGVTSCRPGDTVTSETYFTVCGRCPNCRDGRPNLCRERKSIGSGVDGAFASYMLVPQHNVHLLPQGIDTVAGALTEPLACCVHALERTRLEPGETAIVAGPGTIGLLMMQVVQAAGARVAVLGTNADRARLALARELGAHAALSVEGPGFNSHARETIGPLGADAVFECSGSPLSAQLLLHLVRHGGRYAQVGLFGRPVTWDLEQICFKELQVSGSFATVPSSWRKALALLASGQVQTRPLVSQQMPLEDWETAFKLFENRQGLKILLMPRD